MASPFLMALVAVLAALVLLLQFGVLTYTFERLGLDRATVSLVLLATFLGSAVNLPLFRMRSGRMLLESRVVSFLGVRYVVPAVWVPQHTVVAVNVGGAVVPVACRSICSFISGLGSRRFLRSLPPLLAATAALLLAGAAAPPVAYVPGVLGTLIGADLLNLHRIRRMGAPVVSIGGAGTFDGILLSGVIAVLIASL